MNRARLWYPTLAMMLVSLVSYIDRNTLALLAPTILRETHLSGEQYGWIISCFSFAYMAGNPIWGRILDRVGLRIGMTGAVGFWTIASAAHALAAGFWSFAAARAFLGFGEGATFPGGLRAVTQTLPPRKRSRGIAVAYSGGSLGAMITPLLVTPIALKFGWRATFLFTGIIGAAWLLLWGFISRRDDVRNPSVPDPVAEGRSPLSFRDPRLWTFMISYACGGVTLAFVLYNSALYLSQVMGKSQGFIGKVLWIPPLGWEMGYFVWGYLADRMTTEKGLPMAKLRILMTSVMIVSLPFAFVPRTNDFALTMFGMWLAMFAAGGSSLVVVRYGLEVYSSAHAGLLAGLSSGTWAALVAIVMPFIGRFFDQKNYQGAFLTVALFPFVGYVLWMAVNRKSATERASAAN